MTEYEGYLTMAGASENPFASDGPFVTTFLFCEMLIEGKDHILSVIRIIDGVVVFIAADAPDDYPSDQNRAEVKFDTLICFKSGKSPGKHNLRIDVTSPSAPPVTAHAQEIDLAGGECGGGSLVIHHTFAVKDGGVFWFDTYIDNRHVHHIPFDITIKRQAKEPAAATAS